MRETWVLSLGWEDPLEKEMATHSSTLAWKILWTEEPGRLQSTGSQKVGHNWATSLHFIDTFALVRHVLSYLLHSVFSCFHPLFIWNLCLCLMREIEGIIFFCPNDYPFSQYRLFKMHFWLNDLRYYLHYILNFCVYLGLFLDLPFYSFDLFVHSIASNTVLTIQASYYVLVSGSAITPHILSFSVL